MSAWLTALSTAEPALELLAKATLLLAGAALLARSLRTAPAAARHLAWTLGALSVLALPVLSLATPSWRLEIPILAAAPRASAAMLPADAVARGGTLPRMDAVTIARPEPGIANRPDADRKSSIRSESLGFGLALALGALWVAGSLVALFRMALALRAARRVLRRARTEVIDGEVAELSAHLGISRAVTLVETDEVSVPMTFGALRPAILVPSGFEGWDAARRRAVLLHELAHVRRHDWLLQCLVQFAASLLWFHPLARMTARRLREEAEQAADDLVLAQGTKASAYAAHLLGLVRDLHPTPGSTAMAVSMIGGPFDGRIRAILDAARSRGPAPARLRAGLIAASVAALALCTAVDVTAQPAPHSAMDHARAAMRHVGRLMTPDDESEWFARGMDLHESGEYASAIVAFEKAIAVGHDAGIAAYNIACGHARLGHSDLAMDWLERSVAEGFDAGGMVAHDQDLASLRTLPRFREFVATHEDTDEIAKLQGRLADLRASRATDADAWYDAAIGLHFAGRHDEAAEAFTRADALSPGRALTLYNLACALAQAGRESQALDALERAVESGWDDVEHLKEDADLDPVRESPRMAEILAAVNQLEMPAQWRVFGHEIGVGSADWKAVAARHEAYLAEHPDAGGAWFNLGLASLRAGNAARAIAAFERSRELGFRRPASAYNVACGHALAGDRDAAFRWLEQAREDGFGSWDLMRYDDDLAALRDDPRFESYAGPGWHERLHDHVRRMWSF